MRTQAEVIQGLDREARQQWRSTLIDVCVAELADAWVARFGFTAERALELTRQHVLASLGEGCPDERLLARLQTIVDEDREFAERLAGKR